MAPPKGNKFWLARASSGRKPKFESPEQLWDMAVEYFEWVEDNPLFERKSFQYQGDIVTDDVPKMRAMTLDGLHLFLDITDQTWINYREREDFLEVTTSIDKVIRSQKFAGAAADLLNANIIARDLGLKDSSETTHKGAVGLTDLTSDKLDERIKELQREYEQSAED